MTLRTEKYTRSDIKFIKTDEKESKTIVELEPEEQTTGNDNGEKTYMKKEETHEENGDEQTDRQNKTEPAESTKRILPQRNTAPPARYGDYRAYLTEIKELYEEDLTYDKALRNGWESAIDDETKNILQNQTWEPVEDNG